MALEDIKKVKLEKLDQLKKSGIDPYPAKTKRTHTIEEALGNFDKFVKAKKKIVLAGRIRSIRGQGALVFLHFEDGTGKIQALFRQDKLGEEQHKFFLANFDIGDFVEISGVLFTTKRGEKSIEAASFTMLAKSLLPLPEKWHGLQDEEERLRRRYLDILMNEEVRDMVKKRSIFWNAVREFHLKNGFMEVETPVLENTTGGADANPFMTHHDALDMNVYLRISAGELWQKRLMVAGFEKTFEVGRIFRNEGMSSEHLQDYTQCEAYWAYSNYEDMYKFLQECYRFVAKKTFGTLKFKIRGFDVDLAGKWPLIDYTEEIQKQTGINILKDNDEAIVKKLQELNVEFDSRNKERLIDSLWKYCRKKIGGPAILINEPKVVSPLSKSRSDNLELTERFHFIIAGSEMGQGYSELNDPIDQRNNFEKQQALRSAGDKEAQMADYDFVEALEYGMPPASGHGFSERLFSFLMDKPVRECQIFPLMKPQNKNG